MPSQLVLTALSGELSGQTFVFPSPTRCALGRSRDCAVCLPPRDLSVSRHHCLLEIEPAVAVVRDLGSLNGTYLNGRCIGGRETGQPEVLGGGGLPAPLAPGDELQIGHNVFKVEVEVEA